MTVATERPPAVQPKRRDRGQKAVAGLVIQLFLPLAVLLLMIYFAAQSPVFFTYGNLMAIATQNAPTFIASAAMGAMLIAGYVDLSVGSVLAVAGVAAGVTWTHHGTVPGLLVGLLVGLVVGVINGSLVALLDWSPIVVTLGGLAFGRGLALYLSPDSVFGFPPAINKLGAGKWLSVSYLVWIAILVCGVFMVMMSRLPLGRHITAIGVNKRAAYLAGIRVKPIVFGLYLAVGVTVALAGILTAARLDSAPAGTLGLGFEITVLTAVLLGGIPFDGGSGSLWRVLVGVWLMGVLRNGITLMNVGPEVASMLTGGVLVLAAGLEAARRYLRT
jgi:ribose transport system permease protein